MAKRYSEEEKQSVLSSYWASGQSCAAYSRVCGISVLTLKAWQERYRESNAPGFVAISAPLVGPEYGFRLSIGPAVLDFDRLPPVDWVCGFLKSMAK